jgi:hypothetical protein
MHYLLSQKKSEVAALCRSARVRRLDVFGSAVRDDFDSARSLGCCRSQHCFFVQRTCKAVGLN